jgi:hypothetical protein
VRVAAAAVGYGSGCHRSPRRGVLLTATA